MRISTTMQYMRNLSFIQRANTDVDTASRSYNSGQRFETAGEDPAGMSSKIKYTGAIAAYTQYERNAGLSETTVLKDKSVAVVGCGSLGSTLALSLARAGVGRFHLFDPDRLDPVNIARHQADTGHGMLAAANSAIIYFSHCLFVSF